MPKVATKVKSTRGEEYRCNGCSEKIVAGQQYYEWSFFRSKPTRRHASHGYPKGSMLCEGKMSGAMAACESLEEALGGLETPEDIAQEVQTCMDSMQEVIDEYEEAINNFPNSEEQNRERIDQIQNCIDELDSARGEIESEELNDLEDASLLPHQAVDGEELTPEQEEENEAKKAELEGENEEKLSGWRTTVEDALGNREF